MSTLLGGKSSRNNTDIPVIEGYDVEVNGDLILLQESFDDQLAIIENIHAMDSAEMELESEVASLRESNASEYEFEQALKGHEQVMEATVAGVWTSIKNFFRKMAAKLKAFFDTVMRYFNGLFMSAQKFVTKYGTDLGKLESSGKLKGYKYNRYTYTNLDQALTTVTNPSGSAEAVKLLDDIVANIAAAQPANADKLKAIDKFTENYKNNKDSIANEWRKAVSRSSSPVESDEMGKALFSLFRNGAKGPDDKTEVDVKISDVIATIKNSDGKKAIKDAHDSAIADLNKAIKATDNAAKEFEGADGAVFASNMPNATDEMKEQHIGNKRSRIVAGLRTMSQLTTLIRDTELTVQREWRAAWAERDSTFKSICIGAFRFKAEK